MRRVLPFAMIALPLIAMPRAARAESSEFAEANAAYRNAASADGDRRKALYREAASRYAELARRVPNGHVLYDLGNAYFRAGELGRAIVAWRRATEFLPRHAGTRRNLALARELAPGGGQGCVIAPHPAAAAFFFWHYGMSLAEVEALATAFFFAFIGLLSARLFVREPVRRRLRMPAIVAGVLAGAMILSSVAKLAWSGADGAVVVKATSVRSEPTGRAVELFTLREGAEVDVIADSGEWTRVSAGAGRRGWIETRALAVLADPPSTLAKAR